MEGDLLENRFEALQQKKSKSKNSPSKKLHRMELFGRGILFDQLSITRSRNPKKAHRNQQSIKNNFVVNKFEKCQR
jgi:hypothetical protein